MKFVRQSVTALFDLKSEVFRQRKTGPISREMNQVAGMVLGIKQFMNRQNSSASENFLKFCIRNIEFSNSQSLQDLFVLYVLGMKKNGYFCEFGGADGILNSNSYALESKLDWRGICAEPSREYHALLRTNRPLAHIVEDCVWNKSGETLSFRQAHTGQLSTIEQYIESDGRRPSKRAGQTYTVKTISLHDMLADAKAPTDFDYMSVDTEGSEFEILKSLEQSYFRPKVITVEHNHAPTRDDIFNCLQSFGYRRVFPLISRSDDWYVFNSHMRDELLD
jgi:FkbM family methyltransferase